MKKSEDDNHHQGDNKALTTENITEGDLSKLIALESNITEGDRIQIVAPEKQQLVGHVETLDTSVLTVLKQGQPYPLIRTRETKGYQIEIGKRFGRI